MPWMWVVFLGVPGFVSGEDEGESEARKTEDEGEGKVGGQGVTSLYILLAGIRQNEAYSKYDRYLY